MIAGLALYLFSASLTILGLVFNQIDVSEFIAIAIFLTVIFIVVRIESGSITKITAWMLSIETNAKAVKKDKEEIEAIEQKLVSLSKASAENAYILASTSILAAGGDTKAKEKLEKNLDVITQVIFENKTEEDNWWKEVQEVFSHRKKK